MIVQRPHTPLELETDLAEDFTIPRLPGIGCDHTHRDEVDLDRIARAVREILVAVGENPDREGLMETPQRVARAYREMFAGLKEDAAGHLGRVFNEPNADDLVIVRDIAFHSVCEHHLATISGVAHIAYLPAGGRVVGLSKLARTLEVFARRPQVQERLTNQVADAIDDHLAPLGAAVVIEADHYCMKQRGVKSPCSNTITVAFRGIYRDDREARREVLSLINSPRR
jgi:GTP cyclohydrolase I